MIKPTEPVTKSIGNQNFSPSSDATSKGDGCYVYCVTESDECAGLGKIGLEESEVYAIAYRNLCALVHRCPAESYKSHDPQVVAAWVVAHQKVVAAAWQRWGTVVPMSFGIIVNGRAQATAEEEVMAWLQAEQEALKSKINEVRGKAEYGVQIFWDATVIAARLTQTSPELQQLEDEIRSKPRGLAYLHRQKLEALLRKEMQSQADRYFREFYSRLRQHVDRVQVEKVKSADPPHQMIMNLSFLIRRERDTDLGRELGMINDIEGFSVRFTGPWPPYSFVGN